VTKTKTECHVCKPLLQAIPPIRIKVSPAIVLTTQNTGINCLQKSEYHHKSKHPGAAGLSMHMVVPSTPRQRGYLDGKPPLLGEDNSLLRLLVNMNMTKWGFGYSIVVRSVQQTCITSRCCLKWEQYRSPSLISTCCARLSSVFCLACRPIPDTPQPQSRLRDPPGQFHVPYSSCITVTPKRTYHSSFHAEIFVITSRILPSKPTDASCPHPLSIMAGKRSKPLILKRYNEKASRIHSAAINIETVLTT